MANMMKFKLYAIDGLANGITGKRSLLRLRAAFTAIVLILLLDGCAYFSANQTAGRDTRPEIAENPVVLAEKSDSDQPVRSKTAAPASDEPGSRQATQPEKPEPPVVAEKQASPAPPAPPAEPDPAPVAEADPIAADPVAKTDHDHAQDPAETATAEPVAQSAQQPEPAATEPTPAKPEAEPELFTLSGRVELDAANPAFMDPDTAAETVVYFEPAGDVATPDPTTVSIVTEDKRLIPSVRVVPVGSTVEFPNRDDILHNVFSVSPIATFDLGLYGGGESRSHTFDEPGVAVIHCNVHHAMRADVLVVETPYFTQTDNNGNFVLTGIEPGGGTLHFWHPQGGSISQSITLNRDRSVTESLTLTRPQIPAHLNKLGQPYRPSEPGS